MLRELLDDVRRKEVLIFRSVGRGEERANQVGEIFDPLAQRRDAHADHRQAEIEISAEASLVHLALEIAIGRGQNTDVHFARVRLTHPTDLALLERAEELRLDGERQLSNLVEKYGASVGRFERPDAIPVCPGEGAAHVPKELALDEGRRDRAAVDDDERLVGTHSALDDLGRHELFADAALAVDEDVDVAGRDLLEQREELAHRLSRAGQRAEAGHHRNEGLRGRVGRAKAHQRLPHGQDGLGRKRHVVDPQPLEMRSVQRARVLDAPAMRVENEAAVKARHRRILEGEIVRGVRPDAAHVPLADQRPRGRIPRFALDDQRDLRLGDVDQRAKRRGGVGAPHPDLGRVRRRLARAEGVRVPWRRGRGGLLTAVGRGPRRGAPGRVRHVPAHHIRGRARP